MTHAVEKWATYEMTLEGPQAGNPFKETELTASFRYRHRTVQAAGFYDGDGNYKIRFMPDQEGTWTYTTHSNRSELDGIEGELQCLPPSAGNRGPVRVHRQHHFAYEDGTPHLSIGTTCYVWNHQEEHLQQLTLQTLKGAPFNKIRMCLFPKHYDFNRNEPASFVFEGSLAAGFDFGRFNPDYFRRLERNILALQALGIEADLILFHPYDRWGFSNMDAATDEFYLRYAIARLAAYRNVWWSMANEYDLMEDKKMEDFDRYFKIVQENDPYQHLRSNHNCRGFYDHGKPWVTHCSIQHSDLGKTKEWRMLYGKPVVVDECCYEGNINHDWGNITGEEMVRRFWEGTVRGGYVGHGETYAHPDDRLWWSHGGELHGTSPARIAFLKSILEESPDPYLDPVYMRDVTACAGRPGEYYLMYFGIHRPSYKNIKLPEEAEFAVDVIDTWDMTVTPIEGTARGEYRVELPGKPYIAVRARKIG